MLTLVDEVRARDKARSWDTTAELLAQLHELLQMVRIEQQALHGVKQLAKFQRLRRPGDPIEPEGPDKVSPRQFALMAVAVGGA